MIGQTTKSLNPPRVVQALTQGGIIGSIFATALSLKVFDAVDLGFRAPDEVARECGIQPKAAELLLNALVSFKLLIKDEKGFSTTEEAHYYLVSTSPLYTGTYLEMRPKFQEAWQNLENVLKSGKPFSEVNKEETAQKFFPQLAAALFPLNYAYSQKLADFLKVEERRQKTRVLDLACGSAIWSIPLARENKNVHVDGLDFPPVLEVAKSFTEKSGVANQYSYLSGNWQDVALEENAYDFVVLGHILHSEGKERSKEMLSYVHRALKNDGTLVVAEFLVDETRTGPIWPAMFALHMYLLTTDGCVFSQDELKKMLSETGFKNIRPLPLEPQDASVIIADK